MHVAGIAIFKGGEILLVHATNSSWHRGGLSIPKGHIDRKEHAFDAARREVEEETGLRIKKKMMGPIKAIPYGNGKMLYYYEVIINDYSDIGMKSHKIHKKKLQLDEIDWAGFIPIEEARKKIVKRQLPILDDYEDRYAMKIMLTYEGYKEYLNESKISTDIFYRKKDLQKVIDFIKKKWKILYIKDEIESLGKLEIEYHHSVRMGKIDIITDTGEDEIVPIVYKISLNFTDLFTYEKAKMKVKLKKTYGNRWNSFHNISGQLLRHWAPSPYEIIHFLKGSEDFLKTTVNGPSETDHRYSIINMVKKRNKNPILIRQFEKYWNLRIEKDASIYSLLKIDNLITSNMEKRWAHLGYDFGILD